MQPLTPRAVPPRNCLFWMKEGLSLIWRGIALHAGLSVVLFGAVAVLPDNGAGILMFLFAPLCVSVFAVLSAATDRGGRARHAIVDARKGLLRVFVCSAVMFGFLASLGGIFAFMDHQMQFNDQRHAVDMASYSLVASGASMALAMWFIVPVFMLNLPLLAVGDVPLLEGWKLGLKAYQANLFINGLSLIAAVAIVGAMILTVGFSAIAIYPLVGATMYVAYRDIFLGIPPEKANETIPAASMQA